MGDLALIERNFKDSIFKQCSGLPLFAEYLKEHPDFEFPKITEDLLDSGEQGFVAIPGLFGGFAYILEKHGSEYVLYTEQSSRMDYSSDDYLYFEITKDGGRMLQGEERRSMMDKFRTKRVS